MRRLALLVVVGLLFVLVAPFLASDSLAGDGPILILKPKPRSVGFDAIYAERSLFAEPEPAYMPWLRVMLSAFYYRR